jgi:hypothetical protein
MLCFIERRPAYAHLRAQVASLKPLAESCSRQLRAWASSLQNSEIKGHRHLSGPRGTDPVKSRSGVLKSEI